MKPSRVKIINVSASTYGHEHYSKFIGKEYDVLSTLSEAIELPVTSSDGLENTTYWYEGEYEVLQWAEDDNELEPSETTKSILKGLDEAIGVDKVIISKERYDELLKYEKLYNMIIM